MCMILVQYIENVDASGTEKVYNANSLRADLNICLRLQSFYKISPQL
jgi:hypothetical protein